MVAGKTEIDVYRDGYGNTTHATVVIKPIFKNLSYYGRPSGVVASGKIGPGSFSFQFQFVVPFYALSSFLFENIPDKISSTMSYVSYKIEGRVVTGRSYVDYQDSVKVY